MLLSAKFAFKRIQGRPSNLCLKNANLVSRSSILFMRVIFLYFNAIIQKYNKLSIWLKPVSHQLLAGNAAKHAQPIYPVYHPGKEERSKLTLYYV